MHIRSTFLRTIIASASLVLLCAADAPTSNTAADKQQLSFESGADHISIRIGKTEVLKYVLKDNTIARPFFRHITLPSGIQLTRNSPPKTGVPDDHASMH